MKHNKQRSFYIVMAALIASMGLAADLHARTYTLRADATTLTMPDGATVPAWGFADITPVTGNGIVQVPGPLLIVDDGSLTITITNNLPVPVSLYIPGLQLAPTPTADDGRVMSFSTQAPAATTGGPGSASFTFTGLKPGTFIYQSGTNPATQVPMGLYGAVVIRSATAGQAYNNLASAYDNEQTVVLSEIDPAFNTYVGSTGTAIDPVNKINYSLSYAPKYFLFNGKTFPDTSKPASQLNAPPGQKTLLRLINAGVQNHVPTITGLSMKIIGEDGNYLTYARNELAPLMGAGKTLDAIITPPTTTDGNFFTMFDRRNWRTSSTDSTGTMLGFIESFAAGKNCSPFKGDMNADNKINTSDVLIALNKYVSSSIDLNGDVTPLSPNGLPCGKGTGVLTLSDVMYILQKALGFN